MLPLLCQYRFVPALLLLAYVGCSSSGPDIAYVSGRVTMDGKPLAQATVVFIPEDGRPAGARTDADGRYVLNFTAGTFEMGYRGYAM